MSRIDELIQEMCPNGVDVRPLGEIAELVRGNGMPKTDLTDQGVGAIHYGQIYTKYGVWTTDTISFVSEQSAAKLAQVEPGDVIVTNTSENIEDVCKAVAWLGESTIVTGGHATVIKPTLDPKFLSYWFQSPSFVKQKRRLATGTKVIDVSARQLAKVVVPVPPLEVQREIVRILDEFTQLEAELEAELEKRRQQYEYYRSLLLKPADYWQRSHLKDIAVIKTGDAVSKKKIEANPGRYPVINSGKEPLGFISVFNVEDDPIGVTSRGAGVGSITWCRGKYFRGNLNYSVTNKSAEQVDVRFLFYMLQFLQPQIRKLCTYQGIPALNKVNLEKLEVCIPPTDEQHQIVELLDKFDALANDLSIGLPAELNARRMQYEYYRDQLLTFKELPA